MTTRLGELARSHGSPANVPAAPWTPTSPSNTMGMWFDAQDSTKVFSATNGSGGAPADTGTVGSFKDKSTAAFLLAQATAGNRPTLQIASGINGKQSIKFASASSQFLTGTGFSNIWGNATSGEIFYVIQEVSSVGSSSILSVADGTTGANFLVTGTTRVPLALVTGPTSAIAISAAAIADWSSNGAAYTVNTYTTAGGQLNGRTITGTNNGAWASATIGSNPDTITLGAVFDATNTPAAQFANFLLGEIIEYETPLSAGDRASMFSYLRNKWGFDIVSASAQWVANAWGTNYWASHEWLGA